ncbi:hypothetical protein B9Z19DRAFT_1077159 [Tuber borchii]|uniref:Insertion element IS150 protein InsJ-like helix-turn-helix domain-containing protein n=1 Tax=Tuber borchii TaxID=42251 RepID=A0A2T7A0Y8_TUBBO|nr:hypothetical protein B9Z19DRAFT_1077159 [Tuber borchii]
MPREADGKRREATLPERLKVVELRSNGHSYRSIERETGISKSQAANIWRRFTVDDDIIPQLHSRRGMKSKLDEMDKRRLVRLSDAYPRATLQELVKESGLPIHPKTAGKYLRKENRFVRFIKRKP